MGYGIRYVEFEVPEGAAPVICKTYKKHFVAAAGNANTQLFAAQTRLSKQDQVAPLDISLSRS
jgi:hypothetical protein